MATDLKTADLKTALDSAETIAVVGCSKRATRTSHKIARYLQDAGYRVIPVNPNADELLGERCYPDVQHIPDDVTVDIVNVFRQPQHAADMVRDAIARAEAQGTRPLIWTQLGVSSNEARDLAEEAELPYVKNRCIMVEHGRGS